MKDPILHQRWLMEVPDSIENKLTSWLLQNGCSAVYRAAEAPFIFYAYFQLNSQLNNISFIKDHITSDHFPGVHIISQESFTDENWLTKSREGFNQIAVGDTLFIRPSWIDCPIPDGRTPIVVNPGLAFGTGGHETTRLCMKLLEHLANTKDLKDPVLDIGCGTGILSLTTWILGAKQITAFDNDPNCDPAINDFLQLNSSLIKNNKPFEHFIGTIENPTINGPYGTVVANILLETIQTLLPRIAKITAPNGFLIASGILAECQNEALISLIINNFLPIKIIQEGSWIAILAKLI